MLIRVEPKSSVPVFQQIMREIKSVIARGATQSDEMLPSVRQMASQALVNPNTVAKAFRELEREGILYTRPGLGVFVAAKAEQYCRDDRRATIRAELEKTVAEGQRSGLNARELRKLFAEALRDRRAEDTRDR